MPGGNGYTLFNFYQNQETIRGQEFVSQYRVQVGESGDGKRLVRWGLHR